MVKPPDVLGHCYSKKMYNVQYIRCGTLALHSQKADLVKDVTLTLQVQRLCTFSINHNKSRVTESLNTEYYTEAFLPRLAALAYMWLQKALLKIGNLRALKKHSERTQIKTNLQSPIQSHPQTCMQKQWHPCVWSLVTSNAPNLKPADI